MGAILQHTVPNVMTEDRLRAHWFGGPQVPFWNYDPAQLTIGLEIEYFIARVHGSTFTLATKQQYLEVIGHLIAKSGYKDHRLPDQPGRISKDTERGFIAIKPDFAWHILEIALPPRRTIPEIRELLASTFADVDDALRKVGLERLDLSCLPDVPESVELVDLKRLNSHVEKISVATGGSPFSIPLFPALIAATHVHLNIFCEKDLFYLPSLYVYEREAVNRFMRPQMFRGNLEAQHRTKFYEAAYGDEYKLRTIPLVIPTSTAMYCDQMNSSPKLFPNHPFYPVRDMSFIRPTRHGTFEFRSACSFLDVDALMEIAQFRKTQALNVFDEVSAGIKMPRGTA